MHRPLEPVMPGKVPRGRSRGWGGGELQTDAEEELSRAGRASLIPASPASGMSNTREFTTVAESSLTEQMSTRIGNMCHFSS
jgi:hypothetical protein